MKLFSRVLFVCLIIMTLIAAGCGGSTAKNDGGSDKKETGSAQKTETPAKDNGGDTKKNSNEATTVTLGTSSMGSAFYAVGVGMGDVISKNSKVNVTVEPVGGSDATANALGANKVRFGMLNSDSALKAFMGADQFQKAGKIDLRIIAQGQEAIRQVVALKDANIKSFADMKGKRYVAWQSALRDTKTLSYALLKAYGMTEKDAKLIESSESKETMENMKVGSVDAALIPGGISSGALIELSQSKDVIFVSIPDDILTKVINEDMGVAWHKVVVPAGTYKGQDYPYNAIGCPTVLVARADVPDEVVYEFTKALMSNLDQLHKAGGSAKEWTLESTLQKPAIPFHNGAIKYFKEIGKWSDDLNVTPGAK